MLRFNLMSDLSRNSILHRGGRIVKWKGRTASMVPQIAELRLTVSAAAVGAALFFGAGFGVTAPALAGTCVESVTIPGSFTCSGGSDADTDVEQMLGGVAVSVSTVDGFGIAVDNADAFEISGIFGARFQDTQDSYSAIVGRENGILITNAGGGLLSVASTSTIRGQTLNGISATNFAGGTDLIITSNDTSAALDGIYAFNQGTGVLSITATGTTSSVNTDGIDAINAGTDLMIISNVTNGADDGIRAFSGGTGALTITATGATTGTDDYGIYAASFSGTSLSITAGQVMGGTSGIVAANRGSDGLTITTSGDITGQTRDGINAYNDAYGGVLTYMEINQAEDTIIFGRESGIFANNFGGTLTIDAQGMVRGDSENGISANNRIGTSDLRITSNVTRGRFDGIDAENQGNGSLVIASTGTATGDYYNGIQAFNSANGTSLTINAAEVNGGSLGHGIYAQNYGSGALTISATGDVTGQGEAGIFAYNSANAEDGMVINQDPGATTTGATDGIFADNFGGSLTITALGTVIGLSGDGINADNNVGTTDLTIVSNVATGSSYGIRALNRGAGALSVTSTGTADGADFVGIYARNDGTDITVNAVDTSGGEYGIYTRNDGSGAVTITSTGTANGTDLDGIFAYNANGTDIIVDAFDTSGGNNGIYARNEGTGAITITSIGTADGGDLSGIRAFNNAASTSLSITAAAVIGGAEGIQADNFGSGGLIISVTGDITGQSQDGIDAFNSANAADGMVINQDAGTTTTGAIYGIRAENLGGSLTINALGAVTGGTDDGISALNGAGTTDLAIVSNVATGANNGIDAFNGGTGALTISSTSTANGNSINGITAFNFGFGTSLTISAVDTNGGAYGINALNAGTGALTILSTGTATGTTNDGIAALNSVAGRSLSITAADVSGGAYGIRALNYGDAGLTISVTGDVTGQGNHGIYAYNSANDLSGILQIDQDAGTTITGALNGIDADNLSGAMTINALGTVESQSTTGISAFNRANTTDLTIISNVADGADVGIRAYNGGTGVIEVTSTGMANGGAFSGINVQNTVGSGDIIVNAVNLSGGSNGLLGNNFGDGAMTLTTTGTASGTSDNGIAATNFTGSTDLTINAFDTSGGENGIFAENRGTGALSITSSGISSGTAADGIHALNSVDGTSLSVTAAQVIGGTHGIYTRNYGSAGLTISASGDVIGQGAAGIFAYNSANDVSASMVIGQDAGTTTIGATDGIYAENFGGSLTINALGTTIGLAGDGIDARNRAGTTDLNIVSNVAEGAANAILAINYGDGALAITSSGSASGEAYNGIDAFNSENGTDLTINAMETDGGIDSINARNLGSGALVISTSGPTMGAMGSGIIANNSAAGTGLSITAAAVTGGTYGISARNYGNAGLAISTTDDVTGQGTDGIRAYNSVNAVDAPMEISQLASTTITGALDGIYAENFSGSLTINALGTTIGQGDDGIIARNGPGSTDLIITSNVAEGGVNGIVSANLGIGALTVTSTGSTTGTVGNGIFAFLANPNGTDLTVNALDATGGENGISARNDGTGAVTVTSTGIASGGSADGIYAFNSANGAGLSVAAATSTGGQNGITASNFGGGLLTVTSTSMASGSDGLGIAAFNSNGSGITVTAASANGGQSGINATNFGGGATMVTASGTVSGTALNGIDAQNSASASNLSIIAADTSGGENGIYASNSGSGLLTVSSTGSATGTDGSGIEAFNSANGTSLSVTAADVTGGIDGIAVRQEGTGAVEITTTGTVAGGTGNAITAVTTGSSMTVNNSGTLESGAGFALIASGGVTDFTNSGMINGRVELSAFDDGLVNSGTFNTTADSDFGTGTDMFTNEGMVGVGGTIAFNGLEQFINNGLIEMRNDTVGNSLTIPGDYTGSADGSFGVDVSFDDLGAADRLIVIGAASGSTALFVNDISISPNFGNIVLVVDADAGMTEDAFALAEESATIGFLAYSLSFDAAGNDFFLTNAIGTPVFQTLKFVEGAQSLWYRSADAWAAHMASRRTAPESPLWMQVYGSLTQQDDNFEFTSAGFTQSISLDYDQDYFGFQTGYDFAPAFGNEDVVIGLTGGYIGSDLGFEGSADNVRYDAFNIGVYAGINNGRFFANALAKYDFIDANIRARTAGYNASLDGQAYGVRLEAGYRWGDDAFFIQPLAGIEYQAASLDDLSVLGADIDFDTFNGLRGMAGVRLGGEASVNGSNRLTYYFGGQAVHQSQNGDGLVFTSGASSIEIENQRSNTFGRLELGVNIASPGGVTGFIEGNADIGGGYTGYGGRTGLKIEF